MYKVIAILNGEYVEATSKDFTVEEARKYKDTIDQNRQPIVVSDYKLNAAIKLNNERLKNS